MSNYLPLIGLLGGSFNPAHVGHLYISEQAIKLLRLDELWWIVNPLNPFKKGKDMLNYALRCQLAEDIAMPNKAIKVCDIEQKIGTRYTIDTLRWIVSNHKDKRFVWLMGDDLLKDFHLWKDWQEIPNLVDIAIFPRIANETDLQKMPASIFFKSVGKWQYIDIKPLDISATEIRQDMLRKQPLQQSHHDEGKIRE